MAAERFSLLSGLPPDAFRPGTIVLVEFEAHSPWYEASITLAANALAAHVRTDYHTFQHVPGDVVDALDRQGVDVADVQREGLFRLIDSYSAQTGIVTPIHHRPYEFASQSLKISDWKNGASGVLQEPTERHLLHIDENDSLLVQHNRERDVIDFFQTRAFEAARKRGFLFVHSLTTGIHSKAFYREFESLADVVLDFRTREAEGHLEHLLRVRTIRGITSDSRWRLLAVTSRGEVRVVGPARVRDKMTEKPRSSRSEPRQEGAAWAAEAQFKNRKAGRVFDSLVAAFLEDSLRKRLSDHDAGWRSLVQVARDTALAPSSLYPRQGTVNPIMGELMSRGLVETRVIPGARGRGGITLRVRVAYDRASVKDYVRQRRNL